MEGSGEQTARLEKRLSWGYEPSLTKESAGSAPIGRLGSGRHLAGAQPRGFYRRACRLLKAIADVAVAAHAHASADAAWLRAWLSCEETFPEKEKEAEFQESWRDENRAAVLRNLGACIFFNILIAAAVHLHLLHGDGQHAAPANTRTFEVLVGSSIACLVLGFITFATMPKARGFLMRTSTSNVESTNILRASF